MSTPYDHDSQPDAQPDAQPAVEPTTPLDRLLHEEPPTAAYPVEDVHSPYAVHAGSVESDPFADDEPVKSTGGRHPVHVNHLVWGLVLAGLLAVWGLATTDVMPTDDLRWLLPVPWLVAGVAGLVAAVTGSRRRASRP